MENLEEILMELHHISEQSGKDIYVDTNIYEQEGFYVVVSPSGKIGAFGIILNEDDSEEIVFLVLDDNKIRYLNEEGFHLNDFYKVMGEKLFRKMNRDTFLQEMSH